MKKKIKHTVLKIKFFKFIINSILFYNGQIFKDAALKTKSENLKKPLRTDIINYLLSINHKKSKYLEIGVRNPYDNFHHIIADLKYSVDPGLEFKENPVDFKMTSDEFFTKLENGVILSPNIKFDVIFIDGLHLAEQVDKDIENSLKFIKDDGFIVLHDCNPPTEWHARETYQFSHSPAEDAWNGTTWKAFQKWRYNSKVYSCCIDSDWGVGIISKNHQLGNSINKNNEFFEFYKFNEDRITNLNLINFEDFKKKLIKG